MLFNTVTNKVGFQQILNPCIDLFARRAQGD